MIVRLLDDTLRIDVFYDPADSDLRDNVCLRVMEDCPDEERIFRAEETHLYVTPTQARQLADLLVEAAERSLNQGMS